VVNKYRSFTKAASILHITQPTLSKKISELEMRMGILLFIRGKNTAVRPTPAGAEIFKSWEKIIVQMETSIKKAMEIQSSKGAPIVISTVPTMNIDILIAPILDRFLHQIPELDFRFEIVNCSEQVTGLIDGSIDIAFNPVFCVSLFSNENLKNTAICEYPWYAAMLRSNPLSDEARIEIPDLKSQKFIIPSPQFFPGFCDMIVDICAKHEFIPSFSFLAKNYLSLFYSLRNNDEVFLIDHASLNSNNNYIVFRELSGIKSGLNVSYNKANNKPVVTDFFRYIKKTAFQYPPVECDKTS
jgi:hypothetical protein